MRRHERAARGQPGRVDAGREEGLDEALLDRLGLTEARIAEMAKACARSPNCRTP